MLIETTDRCSMHSDMASRHTSSRSTGLAMKKFLFLAIMVSIVLAAIETLCAWFSARYEYHLFSYQNEFMRKVSVTEFERFINSPYFDSRLGWNNPTTFTRATRSNCVGQVIE